MKMDTHSEDNKTNDYKNTEPLNTGQVSAGIGPNLVSYLESLKDFSGKKELLLYARNNPGDSLHIIKQMVTGLQDSATKQNLLNIFEEALSRGGTIKNELFSNGQDEAAQNRAELNSTGSEGGGPTKEIRKREAQIPEDGEQHAAANIQASGPETFGDLVELFDPEKDKHSGIIKFHTKQKREKISAPPGMEKEPGPKDRLKLSIFADAVIFLFMYGELPWWSPLHRFDEFEEVLKRAAVLTPELLYERLLHLATNEPELFSDLNNATALALETAATPTALAQNKNVVLPESVLSNFKNEEDRKRLFAILDDFSPLIKGLTASPEVTSEILVKVITLYAYACYPEIIKTLVHVPGLSTDHPVLNHTLDALVRLHKTRNDMRGHSLMRFLEEQEKKMLGADAQPGVVSTMLLTELGAASPTQFVWGWVQTISQITGSPNEEVLTKLQEETKNHTSLSEESSSVLLDLKVEEFTTSFILPAYTHHLQALRQLLRGLNSLPLAAQKASMEAFGDYLQIGPNLNKMEVGFLLVIKFLGAYGFQRETILRDITEARSQSPKELYMSFDLFQAIAQDNRVDTKAYVAATSSDLTAEENQHLSLDVSISRVIGFLQKGDHLDKLVEAIKNQQKNPSNNKPKNVANTQANSGTDKSIENKIYVPNAGLVILWPFVQQLFSNLGLTEHNKFTSAKNQMKAIHVLQYTVGFTEKYPVFSLPLNKLLCGFPVEETVDGQVYLNEHEKQEAEHVVRSMFAQWKEMSNTSVEDFQETFVQRNGVIYQKEGNWYLEVENSPLDILMAQMPWELSVVKFPWNGYLLFVKWKAIG